MKPNSTEAILFASRNQNAKDILSIIKARPGLTGKELRESRVDIPRRTLYNILRNLEVARLIMKINALKDARMFKYYPYKVIANG